MTTRQRFTVALLALALAGCQAGPNTHPVPSVAQIGSDLHCTGGDHGFSDSQAGWGFCYPQFWRYNERAQASANPPGLDLTLNITVCASSDAQLPCSMPAPGVAPPPEVGQFAFMIISTYERGDSPNLASWIQTNLNPQPTPSSTPSSSAPATPSASASPTPPPTLVPIQWGNATEAAVMADGKRIALTPHHVVILELRSGLDLLDLETPMSARLGTWRFVY
ncbi:MAG TPA: hypothetical protein VF956_09555 [Candidatus Dormibacteraeota bacterium]